MKGVLICGGTGSRLRPLTEITNKSLLPVYDKPLILYPLQVLLDAGIQDVAIVTGTEHIDQIQKFLGDGSRFGCAFSYHVQEQPGGIAQALGLAKDFVERDSVCAILGDNIYFDCLSPTVCAFQSGAHAFLKEVQDPQRFGVGEVVDGKLISIEEKPEHPKSNLALTGCYLFDHRCFDVIRNMKPSARGELEITDVMKWYLENDTVKTTTLQQEWIDAGTFESLFLATQIVRSSRLKHTQSQKLHIEIQRKIL